MKRPRLKIPTKDLPLVALGITAVLVAALLKQLLIQFLLMGMFFGILSKETRWTYWRMILLIEAFGSFRFLLNTDRDTAVFDTLWRVLVDMRKISVSNTSIPDIPLITHTKDILVGLGNNPILNDPVVIAIISIVMVIIAVVLLVFTIINAVACVILLLPVFGYTLLMLNIFHRNKVARLIGYIGTDTPIPDYVGRLVAPYLIQGIAIESLLATAIMPLIFYRILKRVGFYKRIPGVHP